MPTCNVYTCTHTHSTHTCTYTHISHTHTLGTSHSRFPAVSYVAAKTVLPGVDGVAHDYDEINDSGEVHISRSLSSVNNYCQRPHGERKNFQLITTVKKME